MTSTRPAGTQWESPAADAPTSAPTTLSVHDPDGPGGPARPLLIVGGAFTSIGATSYRGLAAFDGTNWSQVPAGAASPGPLAGRGYNPVVNSLLSIPPSSLAPAQLLVGGRFVSAAGLPSQSLAVLAGCPHCPADFDASGTVDPADIARFVQVWYGALIAGTLDGDFDQDHRVAPADVSLFVQTWFAALTSGC